MAQNPIRTAATAEGGLVVDTLLEAMVKRFGYVLNVGEELGDLEFDTGEPPLLVFSATTGFGYFLDLTDSTTPDDGLTTLVTGNGLRYAIEDAASISLKSVLSTATVPTGSEVVGDAYIVGVGTGAFAGQDDNLAYLTRRGWVFAVPEIGAMVLNEATGQNTQFTDTGWGAFAVTFADGSIAPVALQFPGGIVVEDTLNTPPGSPTTGKFWIVGSVPTGAFVGHGADLAYWTGSAWAFMDPADGWTVFHKTSGFLVSYISGSWLGGAGSDFQEFSSPGAHTWTKPAKGNLVLIECWGAGGGGGRGGNTPRAGGGGGGGAYARIFKALSDLGSSETVTVGAGGPAITSGTANGTAGGNSSFGSHLVAYGGGGGGSGPSSDRGAGGGGGGGVRGAGATGTSSSFGAGGLGLTSAGASGNAVEGGGGGGGTGTSSNGDPGFAGGYGANGGGGGGGSGATGASTTNVGGNAIDGGGGGGGGNDDATGAAGGTSVRSGNGGAGASSSAAATAGSAPGGGGGGSALGNSGKGGDGRVRVTVF